MRDGGRSSRPQKQWSPQEGVRRALRSPQKRERRVRARNKTQRAGETTKRKTTHGQTPGINLGEEKNLEEKRAQNNNRRTQVLRKGEGARKRAQGGSPFGTRLLGPALENKKEDPRTHRRGLTATKTAGRKWRARETAKTAHADPSCIMKKKNRERRKGR